MYGFRPLGSRHAEEAGVGQDPIISLVLLHTEIALTEAALREAAHLTRGIQTRITLFALSEPWKDIRKFRSADELMALAERVGVPLTMHVVWGHDWDYLCDELLPKESVIVLAVRRSWVKTREERMAERLMRAGHRVALILNRV